MKLFGGGLLGGFLTGIHLIISRPTGGAGFSGAVEALLVASGIGAGTLAVLLLSLRDAVVRRIDRGERVNLLLRAYFGRGNGCLMLALWFVTVFVVTLVKTMLLLGP